MKRVTLFLVIVIVFTLMLASCNQKENVPGAAWANEEILEYTAKEGAVVKGTLTISVSRHKGEFDFQSIDKKFAIKDALTKGVFVTTTFSDMEGVAIMESAVLIDGREMVASYRNEVTDLGEIETSIIYGSKGVENYIYKEDGEVIESGAIKIKAKNGAIVDSSAIYTYFRFFDMDSTSYSTTLQVADAKSGKVHKLSFAKQEDTTVANIPLGEGGAKIDVSCVKATLSRTQTPIGASIEVVYAKSSYILEGEGLNNSMRIPVRITENNITYTLTKVVSVK